MAHILGNVQVKANFLIKPLCHKHFPQLASACSKLTMETLEQGVKFVINNYTKTKSLTLQHYTINDIVLVFIVNFENLSHLTLLFLLLTLNK